MIMMIKFIKSYFGKKNNKKTSSSTTIDQNKKQNIHVGEFINILLLLLLLSLVLVIKELVTKLVNIYK